MYLILYGIFKCIYTDLSISSRWFLSVCLFWCYCLLLFSCIILLYENGSVVIVEIHDDVIKWKHFLCYWPFVRGNHRSPVNSPHKGQWRAALMFSLICGRINSWVHNGEAGDLSHLRGHYDVIVMCVALSGLAKTSLIISIEKNAFKVLATRTKIWLSYHCMRLMKYVTFQLQMVQMMLYGEILPLKFIIQISKQ